jgi:two-component sensor histidine kinase
MRRYTGLFSGLLLAGLLALLGGAIIVTTLDERRSEANVSKSFEILSDIREAEFSILDRQRSGRNFVVGIAPKSFFDAAGQNLDESLAELAKDSEGRTVQAVVTDFRKAAAMQSHYWQQVVANNDNSMEHRVEGNRLTEDALLASEQAANTERRQLASARRITESVRTRLTTLYFLLVGLVFCLFGLMTYLWIDASRARASAQGVEATRLLMSELSHRIKNLMTMVQSIAFQTKNAVAVGGSSEAQDVLEKFYKSFEQRLFALGTAHRLLIQKDWTNVSLGDLIDETLRPLADMSRVECDGPPILLSPNAAITINLLVHELATNAVKHGAFSNRVGMLRLHWTVKDDHVYFEWEERGGPKVALPESRGFGSKLIEKAAMRDIGGQAELDFQPDGLVCRIELPLSEKVTLHEDTSG